MSAALPRVVVIGAGIVGASLAYHLARQGAAVTLVDKGQPAGAVTGQAFAWINVSHGVPKPYAQLRHLALQEYRRLESELGPALAVDWCGALTWNRDLAETERFVAEHAAAGYDLRLVERAEIAALEPNLAEPPRLAAFAASEGAVDPVAATAALVAAARQAGAELRLDTDVVGLAEAGSRVTGLRTAEGGIAGDVVVLAAGIGAPALCAPLGLALPLEASPALLLRFRTRRRLVGRILCTPDMEIRQFSDACLLAAEDFVEAAGDQGPDAIAQRTLAAVRQRLRGAAEVELDSVSVGQRPMPADGCPLVGFLPGVAGLYLSVMHAGVAMAPVVGRLAATEILEGRDVAALAPCRIQRFAA